MATVSTDADAGVRRESVVEASELVFWSVGSVDKPPEVVAFLRPSASARTMNGLLRTTLRRHGFALFPSCKCLEKSFYFVVGHGPKIDIILANGE